jgi:hypothetical protein
MANFLANPVSLSISGMTIGAWNTVNASSYLPPGVTGIMAIAYDTVAARFAVRMTGSTDTFSPTSNVNANTQSLLITGVNSSGQFDFWPSNVSTAQLLLIGFFGSDASFVANSADVGTLNTSYTTYNLSGYVPAGTLAAILTTSGNPNTSFRQNGSTDSWLGDIPTGSGGIPYAIVGLDGSLKFQADSNSTTATIQLMGYITAGITWNTNSINRTPGSAGSFVALATESGAIGYLYQTANVSTQYDYTICASGIATLPYALQSGGSKGQMACGAPPTAQISNTGLSIYELAYFTPPTSYASENHIEF